MFRKILIANRGEIAVRVIRTCRALGIPTVAVYSEVDRHALHVLQADEAICIGAPEPNESYLNIPRIIEAAQQAGADAIHPGYGFLSENATFSQACQDANITFIGPPPEVISSLGDKLTARKLMLENNIPVPPGALLEGDDLNAWKQQAETLGYPIMIKASAGGGGKGMRVVHHPDEFEAACKNAASEARSAFGDDRVYMEKYIANPRHIEVQIFADTHGHAIHLFERECSIQRRHQKIIEECPSPVIDEALRTKMGETAVQAALAANYVNAGTVEFLFDPSDRSFYFLEVNTRLQVEHPITECITGLDLVQWQIMIASGQPLPLSQEQIQRDGHAIECRLYAEDAERQFAPSPGTITGLHMPTGPGIRVDEGVYEGAEVPVYYDPILSKLVCYGPDRETTRQRMVDALRHTAILGLNTSISFLIDALEHEAFRSGDLSTHFIQQHMADWRPKRDDKDLAAIAFLLNEYLMPAQKSHTSSSGDHEELPTPWQTIGTWRIGQS